LTFAAVALPWPQLAVHQSQLAADRSQQDEEVAAAMVVAQAAACWLNQTESDATINKKKPNFMLGG
jgi:hypothetical protein